MYGLLVIDDAIFQSAFQAYFVPGEDLGITFFSVRPFLATLKSKSSNYIGESGTFVTEAQGVIDPKRDLVAQENLGFSPMMIRSSAPWMTLLFGGVRRTTPLDPRSRDLFRTYRFQQGLRCYWVAVRS